MRHLDRQAVPTSASDRTRLGPGWAELTGGGSAHAALVALGGRACPPGTTLAASDQDRRAGAPMMRREQNGWLSLPLTGGDAWGSSDRGCSR